jgi:hypothetical protein
MEVTARAWLFALWWFAVNISAIMVRGCYHRQEKNVRALGSEKSPVTPDATAGCRLMLLRGYMTVSNLDTRTLCLYALATRR